MSQNSLLLIGDSILDNAPYARPAPDTATHLRHLLPGWSVRLVARDGAMMHHVLEQLRGLDRRTTAAVLSIGGNDAAQHIGLLDQPRLGSTEVLGQLLDIAESFAKRYEALARAVADRAERTILCTIYEVQLQPARYAQLARIPLAVLNDRIVRIGTSLGMEILELRTVCTKPGDFVLEIEPSATGARKIAEAVAAVVRDDSTIRSTRVFTT